MAILGQFLHKCSKIAKRRSPLVFRSYRHVANQGSPRWLLPSRHCRPRHHATNKRNELAASHSITLIEVGTMIPVLARSGEATLHRTASAASMTEMGQRPPPAQAPAIAR